MIDLDAASAELGESLNHVRPDVDGVRARAARRQRTRRIVGGLAALVLLAGGAAAAAAVAGDEEAREGVIAGPGPEGTGDPDQEPTVPRPDSQTIDLGDLRVRVPGDWEVIDAATDPDGGCGGAHTVAIGDPPTDGSCPQATALRMAFLQESLHGAVEDRQVRNGIELVRLNDDPLIWAAPELDIRLTFGEGVDAGAILGTIGPSARSVALAELRSGAPAASETDPDSWKTVRFDGGSLRVPRAWPMVDANEFGTQDPCLTWPVDPSVVVGGTRPQCGPSGGGQPGDGLWVVPLARTSAEAISAGERVEIGGIGVHVLSYGTTVLEAYPIGAEPAVLLRIGLGEDGRIAASILSSLRLDDDEPEIGVPVPIVLPCGTVAVRDRSVLDLPEDLVVDPQPGMGGWAPGTGEEICAVNLTDPEDPTSHVTFADGPLPYGLGEELSGAATRAAGIRWGTIEDGFGGELSNAAGDTIHVLAYGISEEGAAILFTSLASG